MRFSVSRSPSPVQRSKWRPPNTFSIHDVSDSESDQSELESEAAPVAPALTFSCVGRDNSTSLSRALGEQTVDSFLTAVKLRTQPDPVEAYQQAERASIQSLPTHLVAQGQLLQASIAQKQAEQNEEEMEAITRALKRMDVQRAGQREKEAARVRESVKGMWDGIEGAIRRDEEVKKRAQEEKRRVEEEQRRAEEGKRRTEEDNRRKAEEARRMEEQRLKDEAEKKHKEEEAAKKATQEANAKAQAEREAAAKAQEEQKKESEKAKAEQVVRAPSSGQQEWENAWNERTTLKSVTRELEKNSQLRMLVGPLRRKLRTRVGQVTNSQQELQKIADAVHEILAPTPSHPAPVYTALLSALSKYLLLQAETEVTAKLSTAYPIGRLVWMIVSRGHERLPHVFFSRLIGRTSGWACGWALTRKPGLSDTEWRKMSGFELEGKDDLDDKPPTLETSARYTDRLVGQLALYAAILQSPLPSSLPFPATPNPTTAGAPNVPSVFRLPRLWTLLARILNSPELLSQGPAPQILGVILEVAGDRLHEVYGAQFKKLLGVVGDAVKSGAGGESETPARVRLDLLLERWAREGSFGLEGRELGA